MHYLKKNRQCSFSLPFNILLGLGGIFPSNKTITCLASWVHIAEESVKMLHIKYKNWLHIHSIHNSVQITMSVNVKITPWTSHAAWRCHGSSKVEVWPQGQSPLGQLPLEHTAAVSLFFLVSKHRLKTEGEHSMDLLAISLAAWADSMRITGRHSGNCQLDSTWHNSIPRSRFWVPTFTSVTSFSSINKFVKTDQVY